NGGVERNGWSDKAAAFDDEDISAPTEVRRSASEDEQMLEILHFAIQRVSAAVLLNGQLHLRRFVFYLTFLF
ncbi:MAG: hypothetical protein HQ562_04680, partial [Candidatus Marinimicrobia bacterium]|nr:hypothetical protein [Candidatus Neomarinimicrobiota bacterium]